MIPEENILPFSNDTTYSNKKKEVANFEFLIKEYKELGISLENLNIAAYEAAKGYVSEVENRLLTIEKKMKR